MSYRNPSRKVIAGLAAAQGWRDDDVVLAGTDALGGAMQLSRRQAAAVPASLVRRWLLVKDAEGQPRLAVVCAFVSGDGCLFGDGPAPASFQPATAAGTQRSAGA